MKYEAEYSNRTKANIQIIEVMSTGFFSNSLGRSVLHFIVQFKKKY